MKKSPKRFEVSFAGTAGQGIPVIADILGEAAFLSKYRVIMSPFHEMEVRGGLDLCEIIFCDCEIDYPKAQNLDILVALSQEAYDAAVEETSKKTVQILDSVHVVKIGKISELSLHPLTMIAHERIGSEEYANFLALGLAVKKLKLIKDRLIINLIKERIPAEQRDKALKAFKEGMKLS